MQVEKVHLTKEKATLYARARESRSTDLILRDEMAEYAVKHITKDWGLEPDTRDQTQGDIQCPST